MRLATSSERLALCIGRPFRRSLGRCLSPWLAPLQERSFWSSGPLAREKKAFQNPRADKMFRKPPGQSLADGLMDSARPRLTKQLGIFLSQFAVNKGVREKCRSFGISMPVFQEAIQEFTKRIMADELGFFSLEDLLGHVQARSPMEKILMPIFFTFLKKERPESVKILEHLLSLTDFRTPSELFPDARSMKRKIIMHVGPTNSGKTHAALKAFSESQAAVYLGPLRLLAQEVYERMNKAGTACNLLTGEERKESDGVSRWSCTVEMAPLNRPLEVAVIDEIQMIADRDRGWAWTFALLGLQAKEIHVCGEPSAVDLVKNIAKITGDSVEIRTYKRLTSLTVLNSSLSGSLKNLKDGDAIVTFSRASIFALKKHLETTTSFRAAVIYGSLPPEARAEQARLFNDPNSEYRILIASDAIGMGLNLNIKRVIFERMSKYDGFKTRPLTVSETKQIAGRAGRYRSQYPDGEVTTFETEDLGRMHRNIRQNAPKLISAGLIPTFEQVQSLSSNLPNETYSSLLSKFEDLSVLDGKYFLCSLENNRLTAELIEKISLSLRDRHTFVQAPVNALIDKVAEMIQIFATAHSTGQDCDIQKFIDLDFDLAKKDLALLRDLEITHNILTLYSWLSLRFPNTFTNLTGAIVLKTDCEALINTCLADLAFTRQKRRRVFHEEMESIEEQEAREKEEQEIKPIFMEGHDPAQKPPSP